MKQAHLISRLEWFSRLARAAETAGNLAAVTLLDARCELAIRQWARVDRSNAR
jgi:hypothetical protein